MQAKKYFGQNFITDKNLIKKIVSCLKNNNETLAIEIGPGQGALTGELIKNFKRVLAIEIDKDLEPILNGKFDQDNFKLILDDILKIDLKELINKEIQDCNSVVLISNTPYYITSEILFKTYKNSDLITQSVFMFQKEVAERVCAKTGDSKYNNLSIVTQYFGLSKYEFTVKKNMFNPVPKVDSAIVSIDFSKNSKKIISNEELFIKMIRDLFNNKRKTILNNMKNTFPNINVKEVLLKANVVENLRPENLSLNNFIDIYKNIN